MNSNYEKIPYELKSRRQWAISGIEKNPMSTDGQNVFNISTTDTKYLLSFEEANYYSKKFNKNIGFILLSDDPLTCIDLDVTDKESQIRKRQPVDPSKWTTKEELNRYWSIISDLKSYTESSKYGKGFHIWVKGNIGPGMRRDGIEVYSQERYIICTGKTVVNNSIVNAQEILDKMQLQMRPQIVKTDLDEIEQTLEDHEIIEKMLHASNIDKFTKLCNGDWSGYPSQSEADLALMSMFTFYTESNEQCRRLFRYSNLGQRDKAIKNDVYLNNTLKTIRSRENNQKEIVYSQKEIALNYIKELESKKKQTEFLHTSENINNTEHDKPISLAFIENISPEVIEDKNSNLNWPPGFTGYLAQQIYNNAPRPVREVAIVAALGLLAGICGKSWTIPQSGLNMYIILIARSGIGKEAMHSGISSILINLVKQSPNCMRFVNFTEFASGPALKKSIIDTKSFVNVSGEWGRRLSRLSKDDGRDSGMQSLRTTMTDLYQKSGPGSIVGGMTYSNKDDNVDSVSGVAFSLIGETTPGTFYDSLTESMMSDGFLSRFNLVEYNGDRPPLNIKSLSEPDKAIIDHLAILCEQSFFLENANSFVSVNRSESASKILATFEKECDDNINNSEDECWRQMWNRAALKVTKLAALLAVTDNHMYPIIQENHLEWALELVRRDINLMINKIQSGDVGNTDDSRESKVLNIMESYLGKEPPSGYRIDYTMRKASIITRKYLQSRIASTSSFNKSPMGAARTLDLCLKSLIDSGYISEINSTEMGISYGFHGKAYRILNTKKH